MTDLRAYLMVDEGNPIHPDTHIIPEEAIVLEDGKWLDVSAVDSASVWRAVAARTGAVFITSQPFRTLVETFAERFTVRRAVTGEFLVLNTLSPVILAFVMVNATPAMAGRMASGLDRVLAPTPHGAIIDSRPVADEFISILDTADAEDADPSDPLLIDNPAPEPTGWRRRACDFQLRDDVEARFGTVPELDADFTDRFERFERRLCLRTIAAADAPYLLEPYTSLVEDRILASAKTCGYWDAALFPRFAAGVTILGLDDVQASPSFICDAEGHIGRKLPFMSLLDGNVELHRRQVDRFGIDYRSQDGLIGEDL